MGATAIDSPLGVGVVVVVVVCMSFGCVVVAVCWWFWCVGVFFWH